MKNLISVIITTYKRPYLLIDAIESVLKQTITNFELIVIDDNTLGDKYSLATEKAVKSYINLDNFYYKQINGPKGLNAARNRGIEIATNYYIAFLDDDDLWYSNKLEKQLKILKNTNIDYVLSNMNCIDADTNEKIGITKFNKQSCSQINLLKRGEGICPSSLIVKKECLKAVGYFDESLSSYTDYDLLLKLSGQFNCYVIKEALIDYKVGFEGISRNFDKKYAGKKKILKNYKYLYKKYRLNKYYSQQYILLGQYAILSKKRIKSSMHFLEAIYLFPIQIKAYIGLIIVSLLGYNFYKLLANFYYELRDKIKSD